MLANLTGSFAIVSTSDPTSFRGIAAALEVGIAVAGEPFVTASL